MKKVLIYFAMAVVLALGSTSCSDFLEIEPVGAVNEGGFYQFHFLFLA